MKKRMIFLFLLFFSLSSVSAKSIIVNGEEYKNFQVALFNKYDDYFELALQIDKKITAERARAFVLYFYIPKKLLLDGEDKTVALQPLDINDNKLENGCATKIEIVDKSVIYYFFGDMDSTSIGTSAFNVKGYMQVGDIGSGSISMSNIEIDAEDEPDYFISFNALIDLELTATKFKRRIHSGTASICKRTDTKFSELTQDYILSTDIKIKRYVYAIDE